MDKYREMLNVYRATIGKMMIELTKILDNNEQDRTARMMIQWLEYLGDEDERRSMLDYFPGKEKSPSDGNPKGE